MDLLLWRNRSSEDQEPPEEPFNGGTRKSEIISTGRLGYQTRSAHRLNLVAMECTDWTIMTMLHFQISQSPHNSGFLCQETLFLSGQSVPGPTSPYKQRPKMDPKRSRDKFGNGVASIGSRMNNQFLSSLLFYRDSVKAWETGLELAQILISIHRGAKSKFAKSFANLLESLQSFTWVK